MTPTHITRTGATVSATTVKTKGVEVVKVKFLSGWHEGKSIDIAVDMFERDLLFGNFVKISEKKLGEVLHK